MATNIPYDTMSITTRCNSYTKCCFCVPLRLGCFILGYAALVFNCLRILSLVGVTLFFGIITHGFDHLDRDADAEAQENDLDKRTLKYALIFFVAAIFISLVWLAVNIAALVGLHKKRPGPIRLYVGFASFRLALLLIGFIYLAVHGKTSARYICSHIIDLGLSAYFILVYYIYANQLEYQRAQQLPGPAPDAVSVNDVSFIYPKSLSEKHLIS
ncbi:hypothetical protein K1T71_011934 [Dendrolimus kikuchii]|uniref:Uncharacterized protein n=1 Tax=Dendrolimus kikuchii TaxID=765133 RepID=A0ACC1CMQ9_9NEOP|nr:hypothetical protein K1T71_011934 [Dendrolimus kikuchii]